MGENKGMFDDWVENFKGDCSGFADLAQFIEDRESQAEDYIAAEADGNQTHNEAMKEVLKNAHHLEELSKIAKAAQKQAELAQKQADLAEAESKEAKKDAKTSKLISWVALAFSGVSAVAAVASAVIAFLSLKMPV